MRLINCTTLEFEEFVGKQRPPYAILSHTWETHEISFNDYCGVEELRLKPGSGKILKTCEITLQMGYNYVWIDTCNIDKRSSAELTEAINSMFKWYRQANICIVYLSDLDSRDPSAEFARCRWFTRGWTLQELIAPRGAVFFDAHWILYGTKSQLGPELSRITGVTLDAITDGLLLSHHSVAELMSWAAHRETTREEDIAYCLFGIFGINLPLLYGEGKRAFIRLQEEIIRNSNDLSIFAWQAQDGDSASANGLRGILARSPAEFANAKGIVSTPRAYPEFSMTNRGLKIDTPLRLHNSRRRKFMSLRCRYRDMPEGQNLGIWLRNLARLSFRVQANELSVEDPENTTEDPRVPTIYVV
ncbi:HET-domain-containing protein [Lentithecium fluviatile CBS 122367]|uniref:HET-domain-containing protein n=1 Tax=Lentithecium fluviatile CBS 122367 TaxID=1168545 RepID=A0A6G1JJJ3_9PLEO|nr:HET-domain-containing protein [Lentithecium fluviatile CBS 122367]